MRFRLSTFLLTVTIIAILFAWYVDHHSSQNDINGTWYYPTPEEQVGGYWETLTINEDGTFSKFQQYRTFNETFTGSYSIQPNGIVNFLIEEKMSNAGPKAGESYTIGKTYSCRCAVESKQNLIICHIGHDFGADSGVRMPGDCFVEWYCYSSLSHDEQGKQRYSEFKKLIESQSADPDAG